MTTTLAPAEARTRPAGTTAMLSVLLGAQLLAILDANIINVAAATVRETLAISGAGLQFVIAGYLIAYSVLLITGARIGGLLGPRRVFLAGLAGFTLASLGCGLAATGGQLIGFRFAQGAGAAFTIPQVFSLIQRHWIGPARARALGRYAAVIAAGVLGQILGGLLVQANLGGTGWRPVFWINVPLGLLFLVLGARLVPRDDRRSSGRLDLPGLVILGAALLAVVVPLTFGREQGWPLWCWLTLASALPLLGAFALVERRAPAPLMPGPLFRARGMLVALGALFGLMVAYGGYMFSLALHLQSGLGYSPLRAGLTFIPNAVCFAVASLNWRRLPARWQAPIIPVGLAVATASLVVIGWSLGDGARPGALFFLAQVPAGLGSALAFSPLMARALTWVRPEDAAGASGLLTTTVQLAQVIGLATIGSLYLARLTAGSGPAVATATYVEAALFALAALLALRLPRS